MHRRFASRRGVTPLVVLLITASSFVACTPMELDKPGDREIPTGDVTIAEEPPPAISGGTLAVSRSGAVAVAADPDRDRVWVVDLPARELVAEIVLEKGDEPGRVVEDDAGRFHVALRRGGAVVTIDVASGKLSDRREVCPAPRGIAYDAEADALHVACLGGELVTLPASGGAVTRTLRLERDLRDVIVDGDRILVSKFRAAEVLSVEADGTISARERPPLFRMFEQEFTPAVAWRTVKRPSGGVAVVHQRALASPVEVVAQGGYSMGGCDGSIVHGTVSELGTSTPDEPAPAAALPFATLPVDLAISDDGHRYAVALAGRNHVLVTDPELFHPPTREGVGTCLEEGLRRIFVQGEPIAVAFAGSSVVVQSREPAALWIDDVEAISLPGESRRDTGHEMFHKNTNGPMACASCHPEGLEDGQTWNFDSIGPRRTQLVSGGILKTAPFHWDGDMWSIEALMEEVFERRMNGTRHGARSMKIFARWIDSLPAPPASAAEDPAAVARGEALFRDKVVGCATCHADPQLTDNTSADVGTGKAFQVPSLLRIGARAPFMHNGCAPTLKQRFLDPACSGGDRHGKTSHLSEAQIDDLVAYLETL